LKFKLDKNSGGEVSRLIHLIEFNNIIKNNFYTFNIFFKLKKNLTRKKSIQLGVSKKTEKPIKPRKPEKK
jgi:hypothetical protein